MTTIDARSTQLTTAHAALPARMPDPEPWLRATDAVDADVQVIADPLRPTAADGWSPDRITATRSRNEGGFLGSAVNFTLGGVDERPGQRLSVAQVDQLAPFYATQFGLDEAYVRRELAKVYIYIGGPSLGGQAMTVGHHLYVGDKAALEQIVSPRGRRWLAHELAHTMQFLSYQGASPQRFLADYFSGMFVGRDPQQPGTGTGPAVWGALFTGLRTTGRSEDEIGAGSSSIRDTLVSTLLPATAISVPVALTASGALSAGRATSGRRMLGTGNAMSTMFGAIAAPAIAGSLLGAYDEQIGGSAKVLGTVAGGALAAGMLWRGGAFTAGGASAVAEIGRQLGTGTAIGLATAVTFGGAAIGLLSATASSNTMKGWSSSATILHDLHNRAEGADPEKLGLQDAIHDSHWQEIDAEASARKFTRGEWDRSAPGAGPVTGRVPTGPTGLAGRIDQDVSDRIDWGVKLPLIIGIPAAIGVGAGVLGARTGVTVLSSTLRDGGGPMAAIGSALELLGSRSRGVSNSLGVGAALTVAPLVAGGLVGPLAFNATGSETAARLTGAGVGAVATGALLTLLLRGRGAKLITTSGKVVAGMAVGGALGLAAGGAATEALRPQTRSYDDRGWSRPG